MKSIHVLLLLIGIALNSAAHAEPCSSLSITDADAVCAKVVFRKNCPPTLEIELSASKAQELAELTRTGLNQKVMILINGEVVAEPIVKREITSKSLEVQVPDESTAIRLAKTLSHHPEKPAVRQANPALSENEPNQRQQAEEQDAITGDWILENAAGMEMSPMRINKTAAGTYELIRIGGGPFAICGEYELGTRNELVKVKKPGDAYWDTTWKHFNRKFIIKDGQYKKWTLKREKK